MRYIRTIGGAERGHFDASDPFLIFGSVRKLDQNFDGPGAFLFVEAKRNGLETGKQAILLTSPTLAAKLEKPNGCGKALVTWNGKLQKWPGHPEPIPELHLKDFTPSSQGAPIAQPENIHADRGSRTVNDGAASGFQQEKSKADDSRLAP
jgi:hypothetical protein